MGLATSQHGFIYKHVYSACASESSQLQAGGQGLTQILAGAPTRCQVQKATVVFPKAMRMYGWRKMLTRVQKATLWTQACSVVFSLDFCPQHLDSDRQAQGCKIQKDECFLPVF